MSNTKEFKLEKRSHYFRVYDFTHNAKKVIMEYLKGLIHWGFIRVGRGFEKAPLKIFAATNHERTEFRLHINSYDDFIAYVANHHIPLEKIEIIETPLREVELVDLPIYDQWIPRDNQTPAIEYIVDPTGPRQRMVCLYTGAGKAVPLDTPIHTPNGWSTMGEMEVGTEIYAKNGEITRVNGVYPQGLVDIYKITLEDGRETFCCGDHLWEVSNSSETLVINTKDLIDRIDNEDFYIPINNHPTINYKEVKLDESLDYREYLEDINNLGYVDLSKTDKFKLLNELLGIKLNTNNTGLENIEYLEYKTYSKNLAKRIQYLVRSLGGYCSINDLQSPTNYKRVSYYKLVIKYKGISKLKISSIEYAGKQLAQCISIEHPSKLFVINDFIVTHNSFLTMYATSKINNRFILIAKPGFIDKWIVDIEKTYDIPDDEIYIVKGSKSLKLLTEKIKYNDLPERVILISNKTIQNYLKTYERFGKEVLEMGYEVLPEDLFQGLGGGIRVIDEVHMDFHLNFKIDLYTHTERSVSLSATMLSDDPFIKAMQELAYPKKDRYEGADYVPYINTIALQYQFKYPAKIRFLDTSGKTYSHHVFEQSVIKHGDILRNYLKMIEEMIRVYFIDRKDKKEGDRFIVFCISIDMCTRVTKYLNEVFPDIDIRRYVEDDPYSNLIEPIGRVSTLQSAGTAVDIDQLTTTILTTAVNSSPSNVQGFGRLRMLKDGRNPLFIYFTDMNNPKHLEYHERKRDIIKTRSKNFKEVNYGSLI